MDLIQLQKKFNTHGKCIRHLEKVRWNGKPTCPDCSNTNATKRTGYQTTKYHCNSCNKDFTVLKGTIFEATKLPLNKWFMLIALMLNARKGISALQISRDIQVKYQTAWYNAMKVRCAMLDQGDLLEGIVEIDETYIGGKPRKRYGVSKTAKSYSDKENPKQYKRGRGTEKAKVVGIVQQGGNVVVKLHEKLTGQDLIKMLNEYVRLDKSIVIHDDYKGYYALDHAMISHYTINHSKKQYVDGDITTNTIEGFWSIIKNGIRGQYHLLSKKYLPFYLAEFSYKYNKRFTKKHNFKETLTNAVNDDKCLVNYQPKKNPSTLAYGKKKKCPIIS